MKNRNYQRALLEKHIFITKIKFVSKIHKELKNIQKETC